MADSELPDLTAAGALDGTVLLYIVDQDGNSRKVTLADLKTFINTDPTIVPSSEPYRGARVKRATDQSITNGSSTSFISWSSADIDTDSIWSAGAPTRLTVPTGVTKVRLTAGIRWASTALTAGVRQLFTIKNGATFQGRAASMIPGTPASQTHELNASSAVVSVVAGDYFELGAFQTSGAALNVLAHESTWFEMQIVEAS